MQNRLKWSVFAMCLMTGVGVSASTFIGTDIEDPGSPGRMRILERTYAHGKTVTQNARTHLHELTLSEESTLILKLRRGGIQVIILGDKVRVVVPTKAFFEPGSVMVREDKAEVLGLLHDFVAYYPETAVQIIGHSDFMGEKKQQLKYSSQVAHVVAGYLWANGIPQNRLSVKGVGANDPVTDSATGSLNSRVEIHFQNKKA